MSGGLDSTIAVRLIHDMGIEIVGVHFTGPFCLCNRGKGGCISYARQQAEALGIKFSTIPLGREYIDIVVNPKHGYGSGVNPCMDCRILMLGKARELMAEEGASFVLTGEVLGQRPMSQLRDKLRIIERESGLEGLIVRPLCGQHMPETIPEKEGLISRDKLLAIKGRGRREQMGLAKFLAVGDYPCPAGGCLLTDKHFAARVKDAIAHDGFRLEDIPLLKVGRHFRLQGGAKLVVGRNEEENQQIERLTRNEDVLMSPEDVMGPNSLLRGAGRTDDDTAVAANITSAYCDGHDPVTILCKAGTNTWTLKDRQAQRSQYEDIRL